MAERAESGVGPRKKALILILRNIGRFYLSGDDEPPYRKQMAQKVVEAEGHYLKSNDDLQHRINRLVELVAETDKMREEITYLYSGVRLDNKGEFVGLTQEFVESHYGLIAGTFELDRRISDEVYAIKTMEELERYEKLVYPPSGKFRDTPGAPPMPDSESTDSFVGIPVASLLTMNFSASPAPKVEPADQPKPSKLGIDI